MLSTLENSKKLSKLARQKELECGKITKLMIRNKKALQEKL